MVRTLLWWLIPLTMAGYLVALQFDPFPGRFLLKAFPITALAMLVLYQARHQMGVWVGIGLLFSTGGDIALALDREQYFVLGLGLFLVAHLCYIFGFFHRFTANWGQWPVLVALLALGGGMFAYLQPHLGELLLPVTGYMVVIIAMGIVAALRTRRDYVLLIGAVFFIASDSMIALNTFVHDGRLAWAPRFIMLTYYIAQLLIAVSALRERHKAPIA